MSTPLENAAAERVRHAVSSSVTVYAGSADVKVAGSGTTVVEVIQGSPWRMADMSRALRPTLYLNILSDCSRTLEGLPIRGDADQIAWSVWESLDPAMHDITHEWGAVGECLRSAGPSLTLIPDSDAGVMLSCIYEVIL